MQFPYTEITSPGTLERIHVLEQDVNAELALLFEQKDYPLRQEVLSFSLYDTFERLGLAVRHDDERDIFVLHGTDKVLEIPQHFLSGIRDSGLTGSLPAIKTSFDMLSLYVQNNFSQVPYGGQFKMLLFPGKALDAFMDSFYEYLPALQEEMFQPAPADYSGVGKPDLFKETCECDTFRRYLRVRDASAADWLRRELVCDYLEGLAHLHDYGRVPRKALFAGGAGAFQHALVLWEPTREDP